MMDDLVERLRGLADCDARAGEPLGKCMREAADEIERLRRRLDVEIRAAFGVPRRLLGKDVTEREP